MAVLKGFPTITDLKGRGGNKGMEGEKRRMEKEESCDVSGKPQTHLQLAAQCFRPLSAISSMDRVVCSNIF